MNTQTEAAVFADVVERKVDLLRGRQATVRRKLRVRSERAEGHCTGSAEAGRGNRARARVAVSLAIRVLHGDVQIGVAFEGDVEARVGREIVRTGCQDRGNA